MTYRGRDGNPHYSLASRHKELAPFSTPGPGAYAPENRGSCFQGEKQQPSYSMGGRSKYRKSEPKSIISSSSCLWYCFSFLSIEDGNPSPNSYTLPSMIGPRVPNRVASACYSMPARVSLGGFDTDYAKTPGPARYGTTTPDCYQKKAPTYSMLARNYMPAG